MAFSTPRLVSCSARFEEVVAIRSTSSVIIFGIKNHQGSPLREIETYQLDQIIDADSGPFFFNVRPLRIEILQQPFRFISVISLTTDEQIALGENVIIRFYYNDGGGRNSAQNTIYYVDYNADLNEQVGPVRTLSFEGIDPFVLDARTLVKPERIYMIYIAQTGQQALRVSNDLGKSWSDGCFFDSRTKWVEGFLRDPEALKEEIRVMTQQSDELVLEPLGDAFINDFSTSPVPGKLTQRIYPINRRPTRKSDGIDLQRFRNIRPLVIRTPPTIEPC